MTDTPDVTSDLMAATAAWIDAALHRASPSGKVAAMAVLARPAADLLVTLQMKLGRATLYACTPGAEPVEIAQAELPPLRPHGGTMAAGPETLQ
jgi:hypothetical protein